MFYDKDRDIFLSDFAVEATFKGNSFSGIFDDAFSIQKIGSSIIQTTSPQCIVKTSDVTGIHNGDEIEIDGTTYKVIENHPDGSGISVLILSLD
jgi:hypothetical protein